MAEDLIPAAPPAGRRRSFRLRFAVAYLVLAALAGGAVVGALFVVDEPGKLPGAAWSIWQPDGEAETFSDQIAQHVAPRYRLPSGTQLVGVLSGPPEVQSIAIRAVAIQEEGSENYRIVSTEKSVMYVLCGLGPNCSIKDGKATPERHRLLRREALELALYSLKYMNGVDSVIALLPPPPEAQENSSSALFFEEGDFQFELEQPLQQTLSRPETPPIIEIDPAEVITIERLTRPRLFLYEFQQLQDRNAILVLSPLTAAQP